MNRALTILVTAVALLTLALERGRATDPDVASPLVSYQYLDSLGDAPAQPNVVSSLVSYQYLDSLADVPAQPNVVSPLVSYQYFDWPGDENLTFQSSPNVSYYFSGGVAVAITGTIRTSLGAAVGGATIALKRYGTVFWTGISDANGYFNAPGLLAADYVAVVTKPGYVTATINVRGDGGGSLALNLELAAMPPPLPMLTVNRDPATTAVRDTGPGSAHLRFFKGGQFTTNHLVDLEFSPSRPTIILSHGWKSSVAGAGNWVTPMAQQIRNRIPAGALNIVAWDWSVEADTALPGAIDVAATQGEHLGKALREALGVGYGQHLHFIGHSFGTIVNAFACDYVHGRLRNSGLDPASGWHKSQTTPHLTLMDEAEIGLVRGQRMVMSGAMVAKTLALEGSLLDYGANLITSLKDPIPKDYAWIDNYISAVGFHRAEAVNVALLAPTLTLQLSLSVSQLWDQAAVAHGYAHQWYAGSVPASVTSAAIGFSSSLESGASFPPVGSGRTPGSEWYERLSTAEPFDLTQNPLDLGLVGLVVGSVDFPIFKAGAVLGATRVVATVGNELIYEPLDALGQSVLDGYKMSIQFAGNVGGTVIYKTGVVYSETKQKVGLWWDAAQDDASDFLNSLDPASLITGPLAAPVFKIRLKTEPASLHAAKTRASVAGLNAVGQPAYAWVSVAVPADAGLMAFDFTVTGDPVQDLIACAINEQNVFTLPARFAPDGQTVSTDLIDVSAYAGQTVELFFGLAGGSSTDCEVAIDGVRFITVPAPKLAIGAAGPNIMLKWPAAATGWVIEASESLAPGSWQEVPAGTAVTVDRGVATMEQPVSGPKKFYRLRRIP